jgi:hypothetical protein
MIDLEPGQRIKRQCQDGRTDRVSPPGVGTTKHRQPGRDCLVSTIGGARGEAYNGLSRLVYNRLGSRQRIEVPMLIARKKKSNRQLALKL